MRTPWFSFLLLLLLAVACRKNTVIISNPAPVDPTRPVDTLPTGPVDTPVTGIPSQMYEHIPVYSPMGPNVGGYYEALPVGYSISDKRHPLLIFIHGNGELGDGSALELFTVTRNAVAHRLSLHTFPTQFTVGGEDFSFIVINPQFIVWPSVANVHDVIEYCLEKYKVDSSRIYLGGLSMGGGVTWEYAASAYGNTLAAIVPICGARNADTPSVRKIVANNVAVWAFHNADDPVVNVANSQKFVRMINAEGPSIPARLTVSPTGGHDAWTQASDPEYKEEGKNIYEWMLQYRRD